MTNKPTTVVSALTSVSAAGKHSSLATFVHSNPQLASDLARLVTPATPARYDNEGRRVVSRPNTNDLKMISGKVAQNADDAQAVLELFSDVKIAAEILISSIRSPNDMYEGDVLFELKDNLFCTPMAGKLLPLVRSYFKDVYPLGEKFEVILRGALFGAGSFPILVLPENSLSDTIYGGNNISTETFQEYLSTDGFIKPWGLLGEPKPAGESKHKSALERASGLLSRKEPAERFLSVESDGHKIKCTDVVILDNPTILQFPAVERFARERNTQEARKKMGRGNDMSDRDLAQLLYRNTSGRRSEFVKIKTGNEIQRYSVGRPLILDLPAESVVPVINRGRPDDPVGFIVLLDSDGVPLSKASEVSQFEALKKSTKSMQSGTGAGGGYGDMSSYLLQRTASAFGTSCDEITLRQVNKIFGEILEADLAARLRSGAWGNEVTVSNSERLSELMLYRVFAKQQTQVLFIPAEMLTYFNYKVNDNGTGSNMLQDCMVISSMRAQVLFARVLGAVKNAIGRTKVDVEIDPDEPDSQAVFDLIKTEVVRAKQIQTTPNSVNPTDVLNQIQAASIEFQVTGAKGLPSTKVQFSETNTNYARPDEELNKELTDLLINHIGVPPEMIEDARRPDFATVAIANNVLFSKRVRGMQQRFDPQLAHLVRNMLMSDATFIIELKGVILENIELVTNRKDQSEEITKIKENKPALVDLLCSEFISGLVTTLSRPDLKSIDNNLEALQKHEEMIDKALANIFSQDALDPSLVGEKTFDRIEAVRKAAKAALVRRFMTENGLAQEAFDLISTTEDGTMSWDLRSEVVQFSEIVTKVMHDISTKTSRIAVAADAEQDKLVQSPDATATPVDTSSSSSDTGGGDDLGGMDDMGDGLDDLGGVKF